MASGDVWLKLGKEDRETWEQIAALTSRAERGDDDARGELERVMGTVPHIWQQLGDVAGHVERAWIEAVARKDIGVAIALGHQAAAMRQELAGIDPSPLELMLVARVVVCWLQVQHADWSAAQFLERGGDLREGDYVYKRKDRANRRYLQAVKTLAQVRRLQLPAVQVNIGEKQINVAT